MSNFIHPADLDRWQALCNDPHCGLPDFATEEFYEMARSALPRLIAGYRKESRRAAVMSGGLGAIAAMANSGVSLKDIRAKALRVLEETEP